MANPITWQNVGGVSLADAMRPLDSAQRSFSGMFDGLKEIVTDSEAIGANNVVVQRKNNTQGFLTALDSLAKTPQALQAAIADGSVDRLRASYGQNIDEAAIRGAAESLLTARYDQSTKANAFADQTLDREQAPIRDQIASFLNSGDKKLIAQGKTLLAEHNLRNEAPLYAQLNAGEYQLTTRGRDGEEHGWKKLKLDDDLANGRSRRAADAAQIAAAADSRAALKEERGYRREQRDQEFKLKIGGEMAKLREEKGNLSDPLLISEAGSSKLGPVLAGFKDPAHQEIARATIRELGKIKGMTAGIAQQVLQGLEDPNWALDSRIVNKAVEAAKGLMTGEDYNQKQTRNQTRLKQIATREAELEALGLDVAPAVSDAKRAEANIRAAVGGKSMPTGRIGEEAPDRPEPEKIGARPDRALVPRADLAVPVPVARPGTASVQAPVGSSPIDQQKAYDAQMRARSQERERIEATAEKRESDAKRLRQLENIIRAQTKIDNKTPAVERGLERYKAQAEELKRALSK